MRLVRCLADERALTVLFCEHDVHVEQRPCRLSWGVVRTRGGRITVAGESRPGYRRTAGRQAGLTLVPSGARVFANLTVEENLEVVRGRSVAGSGEQAWTVARVYETFPKLGTLRANMAGNLSGGERQMLAVGRGLMAHPRVLLLDDPSEGLAPVILEEIGELLGVLRQTGLTMILAEQNHRFALHYADRAYLIEKGMIRHEAPAAELEGSAALRR
jgi:branched-chain amino acid transport system ATP-binding protein